MDYLEEIRLKLSIEELVSSYVQLKKAGRNFKGLCPFHSEKTPSFIVSPDKGIAYCFGCHQGGDIFKFIQLVENINFNEAVQLLAERTHVSIPKQIQKTKNGNRENLIEANKWAIKFYQENLEKHNAEKEYLLNRGINEETIKQFKLGFAENSFHSLKDYLIKKGFKKDLLIEGALIIQKSIADKNTYDRFRNRIIFPLFDHQSNPVGFNGRIINEGEPKYLNSPQTSLYNKSLLIYGLNLAKEEIKNKDLAIFVEGNMDVIASHQAGIKNVVASSGTALSIQQLKLISRYTKNIAFAFDNDPAGLNATIRAIELSKNLKLNIKIIKIPNGKDPDECIKKDIESWKKAVENPIYSIDFYFNYIFNKHNKNTIEDKKAILNFLLPIIKLYESDVEKNEYLNRLAFKIQTDIKLLWNDLNRVKIEKNYSNSIQKTHENHEDKKVKFSKEELLLGFIFSKPSLYEELENNLINNIELDIKIEKFYKALKRVYTRESLLDINLIKSELSNEEIEILDIYSLFVDEVYENFSEEAFKKEFIDLINRINTENLKNIQKKITFQMKESNDKKEKIILLNQYNEIVKLISKI